MSKLTIEILKENGYREYPVTTIINGRADRFFQKKIFMPDGGDLFIDVYIYDLSKYSSRSGTEEIRYSFSSQINTDFPDTTFNVETVGWKTTSEVLFQVEAFFTDLYEFGLKHSKLKEEE